MKIYKNQTKQSAKEFGFEANFAFASNDVMSPNGIDITPITKDGKTNYEVTEYDKETKTARISIMSATGLEKYIK